ncbi:UDP-N-acetylmuramoyl-L-alanyl-D-glutamate--2,6-diaminopimelate ligase [Emcibacter sp.]|uniref:UDP-N-acetylmuramoyl-L-alanyl-D-glutamate--2, 6-diaminopimelate ligase n=1 Tax=Emcibacter sp. TaxID=1979954 RepID=UPI002AA8A432|nr:UDP-N-acetylmuramoyl-L-alanyl-D-glutamate--2,6-diaminopimelate ligase [Emcibacter sp.]
MKLSDLLKDARTRFSAGLVVTGDVEVSGITADSRKVEPGFVFVALPGLTFNGADFIEDAIGKGAVAILCVPSARTANDSVIWITHEGPGRVFPHMVAAYFRRQPEHLAAVTGTNGKTSVASFTKQIWEHMGLKAASVGTLGVIAPGYNDYTGMTTPDPVTLHKAMSDLCDLGIDHVVFEASSHGLAQHRMDGLNISAAAFTNLTRDHYDYHGSEENYFYAKSRLFGEVMKPGSTAVLNADCPIVREVADICWARGHHVITVGRLDGDIRLLHQTSNPTGQEITVSHGANIYDIKLSLVGSFQAFNALMAVGLVIGCGGDPDQAFKSLSYLRPVEGRMEQAGRHPSGARIYVDYAHTPDALETALEALKPHVRGKLAVVFGCGGDRDTGKRELMGRVACEKADRVYVTDDNPRSEEPSAIRTEILKGCPLAAEIGNRAEAIRQAVDELEAGDLLLVAGKGHERGQEIAGQIHEFDDVSEVRSAIASLSVEKKGRGTTSGGVRT